MAPRQAAVLVSGLLWAALALSPAGAADLGVETPILPAPTYFTLFQELRVGAFAHNLVHNEDAPVDLSLETISSPLGLANFSNPYVNWFLNPRINFGAMINVEGKTSYAFGGFNWHLPLYGPVFFEGEFGGEVNDGVRAVTPDRVDLGCVATFREFRGFRCPDLAQSRPHPERRAHFPRRPVRQAEPRHHQFRRQGRLQVLNAARLGVLARVRRTPFPPRRFSSNEAPAQARQTAYWLRRWA